MSKFSINTDNVKKALAEFGEIAEALQISSSQLNDVKNDLDASLVSVAPALEAISAKTAQHAADVTKLGNVLGNIVQAYIDCEKSIDDNMQHSINGQILMPLVSVKADVVSDKGGLPFDNPFENIGDEELMALMSRYHLSPNEMKYLLMTNPGLLSALYATDRYSGADADTLRNLVHEALEEGYYTVPEEVVGTYKDGTKVTLHPKSNWGLCGNGSYPNGVNKDSEGRYKVAVAPKILDHNYPNDGRIWADDFSLPQPIDLYLRDAKTGEITVIHCTVEDIKANSYNTCSELTFEDMESGYIQTGIGYPNSGHGYAPGCVDGSVVEFCGHAVDFDISQYELEAIKVVNVQ